MDTHDEGPNNVHVLYPNDPHDSHHEDPDHHDQDDHEEGWKQMVESVYADSARLWEKESQLIRVEMHEKFTDLKNAATYGAFGGGIFAIGLVSACASATILLNTKVSLWAASLIVTGFLLVVGLIMMFMAKRKMATEDFRPSRSLGALTEMRNRVQERFLEIYKRH